MSNLNRAVVLGRLGADPELKYTQEQTAMCTFMVATNEEYGTGDNKKKETTWHQIVAWGKTAELCKNFLSSGRLVYLEGVMRLRKWEDKDGNPRTKTEIHVQLIKFLDSQNQSAAPSISTTKNNAAPTQQSFAADDVGF